MKKIVSLICALALMCSMLPTGALAAYDATKPACQTPGHEKYDGTDHDRPQSCWVKGHFACDGMNHDKAVCGKWGHVNCDGKDHGAAVCGAEGHYACDKLTHAQAACGIAGHCASDGKSHALAACGQEGHYACDGAEHGAAFCSLSGHAACDGADHARAVCGKAGHYACDGIAHDKPACSRNGHCASDAAVHDAAPCGHAGHNLCDGKKHEPAGCGVEGHYACEARAHLNKPASKYCNAMPQHMVCQGDQQHYCDPAQGGCADTYLCSNSNAHTACRMCGLLWCDRTLGGHETPCGNANHRPCVYKLSGQKYVKEDHRECWWCGEYICSGDHGENICVDDCSQCGKGKRYNQRHLMDCGHYWCKPSRERHERCPVEDCSLWMCDEHTHNKPHKPHRPHKHK